MKISALCATAVTVVSMGTTLAHATLGGAPTWPVNQSTQGTKLVQHTSAASVEYSVGETTLAYGTVVHEYASQGVVFAIVWHGPQVPPLNTLLGGYFPAYLQGLAAAHAAQGGGYGPAIVQQTELVVHTGGHMGAFIGRAYLPQSIPQGMTADDLQ